MTTDQLGTSPRWQVAEAVADAVRARHPAQVLAAGVQGALAHDEDTGHSEVELVVVTYRSGEGPRPARRRIDGVLVDLGVIGAPEYLQHARTLSTSWPLVADRYLSTVPIHDPQGWFRQLANAHLARLAEAGGGEFATLAREAWCEARARHGVAARLAEWYDTDAAVLVLAEARTATAVVQGLLQRTYFRDSVDGVRRVGLAEANLTAVAERLDAQAEELAAAGRPVDGTIDDLLG
jgi:hypothetical protein